jgi:hypothetical protein
MLKNSDNETLKATVLRADCGRSKTAAECGIFPLFE